MEGIIKVSITVNKKSYGVYITFESMKKSIEFIDDKHILIYGKVPMIVTNRCRKGYEMFFKLKTYSGGW